MGGEVELTECRESLEHQSKISDLLLDALSLNQLSFDEFDLEKYLTSLLKSVGEKFEVPLIILRTEDKLDRNKLNVLACYGVKKEEVDSLTMVTKQSSMAANLASLVGETETGKKQYIYIDDIENKQNIMGRFDQETLAKKKEWRALFSCPITVDSNFVGFIVFYKKQRDSFPDAQQEFLGHKLIDIIQRVLAFAELMDRAKNRFDFLFETYDPEGLSLLEFDLKDHLNALIEDVGKKFELRYIILRREDDKFRTTFHAVATYGFVKGQKVPGIVYINDSMAHDLSAKIINGEEERFIHLKDIQNPKVRYDQKEFAKKYNLNSVLASPIVVKDKSKDKFKGFIVYLSEKMEGFDNKVQRKFLAKEINLIIEKIFIFSDSFNRIHLQYLDLHKKSEYEKKGHQYTSGDNRACACHYAAKNYLSEDIFDKAGHNFHMAAENMSQLSDPDPDFIIENYTESSMAYARGGTEENRRNSQESYDCLKDYIDKCIEKAVEKRENIPEHDFYYNKLIKVLDANGFDKFAGEVYIDKMHQRLNRFKTEGQWLRCGLYWFWKWTSNYGESAGKFIVCTFLFILAFAIVYSPWPSDSCLWGPFCIQLEDKGNSFIYDFDGFGDSCLNFVENVITAFPFSSAVFSTLGFSNITPANWWAHVIVTIEVFLGYAFLGTFVTVIGRKFLRKTY